VVLGHSPRATPRRLYTSSLYWKVVGVDAGNFLCGYNLERIKRRHKFLVKDAGFNAIYARDLQAMEALAGLIGDDPARFAQRRRRVAQSMLELLYDEKAQAFLDVQEPGARKIPVLTPTIFFPLAIDLLPQSIAESVVAAHLERDDGFKVPCPMPTVKTSDPAFFPGQTPFLWRGPTWSLVNWFLCKAFDSRGMTRHAEALRNSLRDLVARSGFREYYHPINGDGLGAKDFTWSGLLIDM
jgi:glycogen debranching enzyme